MHRTHRESLVDFLVSLVGIFPTVCGYCNLRGQRLYAKRPTILLATGMVALGSYIAHGVWLKKSTSRPVSPVVILKAPAPHATPQTQRKPAPLDPQ